MGRPSSDPRIDGGVRQPRASRTGIHGDFRHDAPPSSEEVKGAEEVSASLSAVGVSRVG